VSWNLDPNERLKQADALLRGQRYEEAIAAYRSCLATDPTRADGWFNLAWALRHTGRFEQALDAYADALRHGADMPEQIHLNRAAILSGQLHRDDDALRELEASLARAPGYFPALVNLGNLHEERGERDAATGCYRRVLDLQAFDPSQRNLQAEALARLAQLHPPASSDDPMLARLEAIAALPDLDDTIRANLLFSLGRARDRLDQPASAFRAFTTAKQHAHRRHPAYAAATGERVTQALLCAPAPVRRTPASGEGAVPLFICGMFRSGSTLLEQILAGHPAVAAGGEMDTLPRMVATDLAPFPSSMATLDTTALDTLARRYHAARSVRVPDADGVRYVTDKRPDNYRLIGLIRALFPDARIVLTTRHPLDTCLSIFMQHLNPRACPYAGSLMDIGHHYLQYRRLMEHWLREHPGHVDTFDYDAFVAAPRSTLQPLMNRLGLDWNPALLEFHRRRDSVRTASYWQVRRPLYTEASGRWRRYAAELEPLRALLAGEGVPVD